MAKHTLPICLFRVIAGLMPERRLEPRQASSRKWSALLEPVKNRKPSEGATKPLQRCERILDAKLVAAGFLPIHGHWKPDWMAEDRLLSEALEARREIVATSDKTDGGDRQMGPIAPKPPEDPIAFLRAQVIEDVPDMVLGGFAEWLMNKQGLSPKTAGNRITPLKVMWTYAIQKHILKGPNSWTGATTGLKRKAGKKRAEPRA